MRRKTAFALALSFAFDGRRALQQIALRARGERAADAFCRRVHRFPLQFRQENFAPLASLTIPQHFVSLLTPPEGLRGFSLCRCVSEFADTIWTQDDGADVSAY